MPTSLWNEDIEERCTAVGLGQNRTPDVVVRRLPVYLRVLNELIEGDIEVVSSSELARRTGFTSEQIRKDLACFGAFGTRGVGYNTRLLSDRIRKILGLNRGVNVALVGAGNLGTALARYNINRQKDVRIVAIFDNDERKLGRKIEGVTILSADEIPRVVKLLDVRIGIIAVPASEAQKVADQLVEAGIEAILNFSPAKIEVSPHCYLQNIDLTTELQSLAYYAAGGGRDRLRERTGLGL